MVHVSMDIKGYYLSLQTTYTRRYAAKFGN